MKYEIWAKRLDGAKSKKDRKHWLTDPIQTLQLVIYDTPSNSFREDSSQKTDDTI